MSTNLSQKALRAVFKDQTDPMNLEAVMTALEEADVAYNGDILKGTLAVMVEKGYLTQPRKGQWAKKPRASGGGTPSVMFKVDDPLNPMDAKIEEMPYDKAAIDKDKDGDNLLATTKPAAVRKAKAHWYTNYYLPRLDAYRQMEESVKPASEEADAEK